MITAAWTSEPLGIAVVSMGSPTNVLAVLDGEEWLPLAGVKDEGLFSFPLPECFQLNDDCLTALNALLKD